MEILGGASYVNTWGKIIRAAGAKCVRRLFTPDEEHIDVICRSVCHFPLRVPISSLRSTFFSYWCAFVFVFSSSSSSFFYDFFFASPEDYLVTIHIRRKAEQLKKPIVTLLWIKQCLIDRRLVCRVCVLS